jgi:hypothetical protein
MGRLSDAMSPVASSKTQAAQASRAVSRARIRISPVPYLRRYRRILAEREGLAPEQVLSSLLNPKVQAASILPWKCEIDAA